MHEFLETTVYFGVLLSLTSYGIGTWLKGRLKWGICNPLLIAIVLTIAALLVLDMDYDTYYAGAKYLSYLLTPATIALAVPLYEQFEVLKKNPAALLFGIGSGVLASVGTILLMAVLFGLDHSTYVTLLPKSITTAIGMGVSEELGGHVPVTVALIILTGVQGNIFAELACRVFRITEPIAKGVAIGTAAHAIGTAKAMEMGEVEGAMSSLSIVVAGVLTVVAAAVFAGLW